MSLREAVGAVLFAGGLAACGGRAMPVLPSVVQAGMEETGGAEVVQNLPTPIQHVIIVFQENRTPDYLFQGIPNADIKTYGYDSKGQKIALRPVSLAASYDLDHGSAAFVRDYDDGKMDGFDLGLSQAQHLRPFAYGRESEVKPYHDMARQYVFGDHMFQSNEGPSYPAHLFIVSGTATDSTIKPDLVRDNPFDLNTLQPRSGGCDLPRNVVVPTINPETGAKGSTYWACFDPRVLSDFLDAKRVSWRYYQQGGGGGLWHAFDSVRHVRYSKDYANVIPSSSRFLADIAAGKLAGVTWLTPADQWSDHARQRGGTANGPSYVAAVVNAVGTSKYWKSTAILVTWDDWGGWYDHVKPPIYNHYELGLRVPLLVISPYAKKGYVSKRVHEFGSLLAFTEETFGIPKGSLHATDGRADDLRDAFDFSQKPRTFVPIKAPPFDPGAIGRITNDEDP